MPNAHFADDRFRDGICDMPEIPRHKEIHPMHSGNRDVKGIGLGDGRHRTLGDERGGQFRYARRGYVEFRHIFEEIKPLTGDLSAMLKKAIGSVKRSSPAKR